MDNKYLLCRFEKYGGCRDQENCQFSHDETVSIEIPENVCVFNLQKKCWNTAGCRFDHLDAKQIYESVGLQWFPDSPSASDVLSRALDTSSALADELIEVDSSLDPFCPAFRSVDNSSSGSDSQPSSSSSDGSPTVRMVEWKQKSSNKTKDGPTEESSGKTYAQVCNDPTMEEANVDLEQCKTLPLCPFGLVSDECPHRDSCQYLHGNLCDLCSRMCLHPYDEEKSKSHHEECVKDHEKQMELSFAIQRSTDKNCGICMDVILDKDPIERRFGILEKCNHIFCLTCIRKWRQTKQFDNRTIRACPECRVNSDFVVPSKYWVEDKDDKDKLINEYKNAMSNKPCKYFKEGRGECPFAGACFYRHAYPDGSKADMPPPRVRRTRQNQEGELETLRDMLLWNYLEVRDDRQWLLTLDMDELMEMREFGLFDTDSDDSDYSD